MAVTSMCLARAIVRRRIDVDINDEPTEQDKIRTFLDFLESVEHQRTARCTKCFDMCNTCASDAAGRCLGCRTGVVPDDPMTVN